MSPQRPYKRRQFYVKKEYQTKFILKFCLLVLAGSVLSTALLGLFSRDTLTSTFENSQLVVQNTALAILPSVVLTNLITLLLIGLATTVVVLYISHKIAGPIFRFEKELKRIAAGDLTVSIQLRKDDQFKDLAESLNDMTKNLNAKMAETEEAVKKMGQTAAQVNAPEEIRRAAADLEAAIRERFRF